MDTVYDQVLAEAVSPQVMAPLVIADQKRLETRLRAEAERISAMIVELARESMPITGQTLASATKNWTKASVARAKEMVK